MIGEALRTSSLPTHATALPGTLAANRLRDDLKYASMASPSAAKKGLFSAADNATTMP
jgi:hypothetical protein